MRKKRMKRLNFNEGKSYSSIAQIINPDRSSDRLCTARGVRTCLKKLSTSVKSKRVVTRAWSIPVTWERWRSHHSIRHSQKLHAARKLYGSNGSYWRSKFYVAGIGFSTFFVPVTLNLTQWPSYRPTNLTRIPWRYTECANMNFLCPGFRKLSSDRQTNRQRDTTEIIYHAALRVFTNMNTVYVINSERYTTATYCSALRRALSPAARRQRHLHGCRERGDDGCAAKTWRKVPRVADQ